MRDIIISGNWKMNKDLGDTTSFCTQLRDYAQKHDESRVKILIAPAYPFLYPAKQIVDSFPISLAAQNVSINDDGAFTGEVSATMLRSLDLEYCIVGHSERRQYHAETDATVRTRIIKLMEVGIIPIICIGETLAQREAEETEAIVISQIQAALQEIEITDPQQIVIAYEPVWAIGTGRNATPQQAQDVHLLIRNWLNTRYGNAIAAQVIILYGGSMKPENIDALLAMPDIDGGLIGGASLQITQFTAMIQSAKNAIQNRR